MNGGGSSAYNSVLCGWVPAATRCFACALATNATYTTWSGGIHSSPGNAVDCVFTNVEALALSPEDWTPLSVSCPLVDAGRADYVPADMADIDLAGVPRVLNGAVDIGAYEWDWRRNYRFLLARGRKWLSLEDVSPGVVAVEKGLRLSSGATLTVALAAADGGKAYRIPYATTSMGSLAIWRAGEEEKPTLLSGEGVDGRGRDPLWIWAGNDRRRGDVVSRSEICRSVRPGRRVAGLQSGGRGDGASWLFREGLSGGGGCVARLPTARISSSN